MSNKEEEIILDLIQKKQGISVPRIAFELKIDEKIVWDATKIHLPILVKEIKKIMKS